ILGIRRQSRSAGLVQTQLGAWQTGDGGATWQPAEEMVILAGNPPDCSWGQSQSWLDSRRGWALCGEEPTNSRTMRKRVFRTGDGGQTWELLAWTASGFAPTGTLSGWGYPNGIWFIDGLHGWFGNGIGGLLATSDGGYTWNDLPRQGLPEGEYETSIRVFSPVFTSRQHGVITIENRDAQPQEPRSATYVTGDGGQSWHQIAQEPPAPPLPGAGWRLLDERNGIGVDAAGGAILATANRGATWREQGSLGTACPAAPVGITATAFADAAHGWALVSCAGSDPASKHALARTADGGRTWTTAGGLNDAGDPALALDVVDESTIFVLRASGAVLASGDGGATWAARAQLSGATALEFISPSEGWAVQSGRLLRSSDGGATWEAIATPAPVQTLWAATSSQLWAISARDPASPDDTFRARLLRSADAGATWQQIVMDDDYDFYLGTRSDPWPGDLSWADPLHGWLILPAALFWTGDGGQTWTQLR
ncbi:MAG TPA: hypothetical protein VD886_13880, partial [Herpetosiphonaceae bacterium]|nr:hypothetical protein [Herpetosiphonaceae bacterium]